MVRVLGRDEADAQLMSKFWRSLAYKDGGPALHTTRLEDVEAQAYALLLAERAGVHVPAGGRRRHRRAGRGAHRDRARSPGTPLVRPRRRRRSPTRCSPTSGSRSPRCTTARVAHGRLNCNHVVVDGTTVGIGDFEFATGAAATGRRAADVAELLVSTALLVGDDRAVAAARTRSRRRRDHRSAPLPAARGAQPRAAPRPPAPQGALEAGGVGARGRRGGHRHRRAAAPGAPPGQRHQPHDGGRHADRHLRPAEPGREPAGAVGHDHQRRHRLADRGDDHLAAHQLRRPRSR